MGVTFAFGKCNPRLRITGGDTKTSTYGELGHLFDKFLLRYVLHKFCKQDFNAQVKKDDILQSTLENYSLIESSNANKATVKHVTSSEHLVATSTLCRRLSS